MKNKIIHTAIALVLWTGILAQNYPVQVFVQVSPPYTSYLPDYADPSNEQLKVFITLTDITVPAYDVKLRFKFQGNGYSIENPTYLNLPPITITPGVPYELSGAALAAYLNSQNLIFSGVNVQDYESRKVLPEGPCTICVEVYDYNTPNQTLLGNPSCTNVWFSMYDPPFLNTPFCGSEVMVSTPQQILFNWTPLNMNSPFSLNTTEYVFELFEKRPEEADPNVVVNSTLPIYLQVTNQPFVNYGITEPQLQVGRQYVWRVQVRDNSNRDYFKNNGYSQVCEFTYGNLTTSQIGNVNFNLQANGTGVRQGYAWWNINSIFNSYQLEVRKTGNSSYRWFPYETSNPNTRINSLEPETEYECRVRGIVGVDSSDWSNTAVFTTQPATNYACGNTTLPATQTNIVPLINAIKGMVFTIGQFDMMVTSITPLSTDGHYRGAGKISIPFMLTNLNVSFEDILVDDNLVVRSGKVETITQGVDSWLESINIDKAKLNPTHIDGVIDSVYFINDSVALIQFGNQQLLIDSFPTAIYDSEGNVYYVFEDGTIILEFNGTISEDTLAASDSLHVVFEHLNEQNYGFDAFENALWTNSYETIELSDGTRYFVPYKSILTNGTDYVLAKVRSKTGFTPTNLTFECLDGRPLTSEQLNDSTYKISLDQFEANEEAVYAMWNSSKMGKLNVRAYDSIQKEVVLVPVNGASVGDRQHIESLLNQTYKQAVVNWNVTIDSNFVNVTWDANGDGNLANADATLMTKYSAEMRALRDAYLNSHSEVDNRKSILFVVPNFEDNSTLGYMVRGKGVGFLSANPQVKTIAHELGHGAFGLYHTFPTTPQGSTQNLLDYTAGSNGKLNKYQWEKVHNWSPTLSLFDDEEEGAFISEIVDSENNRRYFHWYPENINSELTDIGAFYTPSGKIIYLNNPSLLNKLSIYFDVLTGGVAKFNYDNVNYQALYTDNIKDYNINFYGYVTYDYYDDLRAEFPNRDVPRIVSRQAQALQGNQSAYFSDFSNIGTHKVVGMLTELGDTCNKTVVKWTNNEPIESYLIFSNGIYAAPLNTTLQSLTESDFVSGTDSVHLDNDLIPTASPQIKSLMCQLVGLYSKESSLERMYLEKYIIQQNYSSIYDFAEKDVNDLTAILDITKEYQSISNELMYEYDYTLTTNMSRGFIIDLIKGPHTRVETNAEYLTRLKALKQKWKNDANKIAVSSDEDFIAQIIQQHSDNELKTLSKEVLVKCLRVLVKDWMFNGEETVANRILIAASTKSSLEATYILDEIIKYDEIKSYMAGNNVQHHSVLEALYDRINGDGNNEFVRGLYALWLASDEYTNIDNPLYEYDDLDKAIYDYRSTSTLGFYNSNYNFYLRKTLDDALNPYLHQVYIQKEGEQNVDRYHILQPIAIMNVNQEGVVRVPHNKIPAFILYAFDKMNGNANAVLGAELALDVLSVAVGGVGLISKLRHLGKLSKLSRGQWAVMSINGVEFTSGTANLVLSYACDNNDSWCQKTQDVLTLIELLSLSADALLENVVKIKAKNILDNNLIPNGAANKLELENLLRKYTDDLIDLPALPSALKSNISANGVNLANINFIAGDADNFFDVIIHSNSSGEFVLKMEEYSEDVVLSSNMLADIIKSQSTIKSVRLLSCNSEEAAMELSSLLGDEVGFYACDGYVDITTQGIVTSQNKFYKYNDGNKISQDYLPLNPANAPPPAPNSNRIRLGLANAGDDWLTPNLLSKLDGFGDALLKQKFLDDFLNASTETKALLNKNPNAADIWKAHTTQGQLLLAENADIWLKHIEARQYLKNGQFDDVAQLFNENTITPSSGYVANDMTVSQISNCNQIINSTTDIQQIVTHSGISNNIITSVKNHFWKKSHLVKTEEGFVIGKFGKDDYDIQQWLDAQNGFQSTSLEDFKKLVAHEYIESKLMEKGLHYRSLDSPYEYNVFNVGAHDISPLLSNGQFLSLDRTISLPAVADDLSNLDDIISRLSVFYQLTP